MPSRAGGALPLRSCGAAVCMWVCMLRRFRIHPTSWHVDTPTPLTHCPLPCRYEVNPELVDQFEAAGLRFVGKDDSGTRMEIVELSGHPFFVVCVGWGGGGGRGGGLRNCSCLLRAHTGLSCRGAGRLLPGVCL